jgi:hypothetical protein
MGLRVVHFAGEFASFVVPALEAHIDETVVKVLDDIKSSFVIKSLPSHLIELCAEEISLSSDLLSLLQSKLCLKSWFEEGVIGGELVMESEKERVKVDPCIEEELPGWIPEISGRE